MPLPRKKSCYHCRLARTRCNLALPHCARCLSRGLRCDYGNTQTSLRRAAEDRRQVLSSDHNHRLQSSSTCSDVADGSLQYQCENASGAGCDALNEADLESLLPAPIGSGKETVPPFDWNLAPGSVWQPLSQPDLDTTIYPGTTDSLALPNLPFIDPNNDDLPWLQQAIDLGSRSTELTPIPAANSNIPTPFNQLRREEATYRTTVLSSPPPPLNWSPWRPVPRSRPGLLMPLKHKNFILTQTLTAKFIIGTMTSYPGMLLANSKAKTSAPLPPYIHPYTAVREDDCSCVSVLPEPLANCASLLHMYETRTPASEAFVWRSIFAEQERLYKECKTYPRPLLLAALQAIAIYILLQAREGQHDEYATVGLVLAMGEMSLRLYKDGLYSPSELELSSATDLSTLTTSSTTATSTFNPSSACDGTSAALPTGLILPSWGEWTYIESLRRTATLLFLINWLLDVNIGFFAPGECSGLERAPLPAPRELWEARSREEWEGAYRRWVLGGQRGGKHVFLTVGTLREVDLMAKNEKGGAKVSEEQIEELGRWCAGVDGFGSMILMAALTRK